MSIYDHFLKFGSEVDASVALAGLGYSTSSSDGKNTWDLSCVTPGVELVMAAAVWSYSVDLTRTLVSPRECKPGYFVVVSLPAVSENLLTLAGFPCRFVLGEQSIETSNGAPVIVAQAPDFTDSELAGVKWVEPGFSGRSYQFGVA